MPSQAAIDDFLAQRHIAFVGVSRNPKAFANTVYLRLRAGGRTLYPVNRGGAEKIENDRCYAQLGDVPDPVDGVVVMVPEETVPEVVQAAVDRGIPRVWLHRGLGQGPVPAQAVAICRGSNVRVVDGACPIMFEEPVTGFHRLHRLGMRRRIRP